MNTEIQALLEQLPQGKISFIPLEVLMANTFPTPKEFNQNSALIYYISPKNSLLPFLSLEDNLLLSINKTDKASIRERLNYWLDFFKINQPTSPSDTVQTWLAHLARALALKKENIFLEASSEPFIDQFLKPLLPSLTTIAKKEALRVVILSDSPEKILKEKSS